MIESYFQPLLDLLSRLPFVESPNVSLEKRGELVGFVRGEVEFSDGSTLFFRELIDLRLPLEKVMYSITLRKLCQLRRFLAVVNRPRIRPRMQRMVAVVIRVFVKKIRGRFSPRFPTCGLPRYAYHYQSSEGALVFRYDNTAHHRTVSTFPFHKHLKDGDVTSSAIPSLEGVLRELEEIISQRWE